MMIFFLLIAGSICLGVGAELLVRGGASFAFRMGLPIVVIGLTIMGYGTGTPELIVSMQASLVGRGDIALGNVIGSNIANIGLILGISAIIYPLPVRHRIVRYDGPIMVVASLLLCLLIIMNPTIGRFKGSLFLLALVGYTSWAIWHGKNRHVYTVEEAEFRPKLTSSVKMDLFLIIIGFFILFAGGRFFLNGAVSLAKAFHVSDAVIGLTVVALGTSLPELATSLVAIYKKHEDIALGNIVGSSIFNIFAIVGLSALINPIQIENISWFDYTAMTAFAVVLYLIMQLRDQITRSYGILFLVGYILYIAALVYSI